jgi:hypothetical protein
VLWVKKLTQEFENNGVVLYLVSAGILFAFHTFGVPIAAHADKEIKLG